MAEAADAQDGDQVAGTGPAVAQGVERGDAGAQQGCRGLGIEFVRDARERVRGRDHVVGIAAVVGDAGDAEFPAGDEVAAAAAVAMAAVAAVPAHADPLFRPPRLGPGSERVDAAGDLVARHPRVADARKAALLRERIAVADTAGLHPDPDLAVPRARHLPLDQLERRSRRGDLDNPHAGHGASSWSDITLAAATQPMSLT